MSSSPTTKAPAAFVCDCGVSLRSACEGLPFYKKHEGKRYCVLHYPGKDKVATFNEALKRKLDAQDFDFSGVWFPDVVDFNDYTFNSPASFTSATFSAEALFTSATFSEEASFHSATFIKEADFYFATFSAVADFNYAMFSAVVYFNFTTFGKEAYFNVTSFNDYIRFAGDRENKVFGDDSFLNFQLAKIEKPDRLSFHTVMLRPHWFVNVDARKFEFIDVNWNLQSISTKQEIKSIPGKDVLSKHRLLAIACRNLAVNAEENHRYEEASGFRYMAMETRRLERWRGFAFWTLGWWYWVASGYGERVWRAFVVLIVVWLLAAALYTRVGFVRWEPRVASEQEAAEARRDVVGVPLRWQRALTYSLGVMTLQKPEPRPATNAAQGLVMLETILGPVQAALLALAIRRKFMR